MVLPRRVLFGAFLLLLDVAGGSPATAQPSQFIGIFPLTTAVQPVGVVAAGDGSGRLFVVQQTGQIRVWNGTQLLATPFLNIGGAGGLSTNCGGGVNCGERGLLGLAFHPNYETNGFFYVFYTRDSDGDLVLARYAVSGGNANVANPATASVLMTIEHSSAANHNGGALVFRDGLLHVAVGDGGGAGENGQDKTLLVGKILRIDVDSDGFPGDASRNYAIPSTNPFAGATAGADEIWAWGLRNPWRITLDRVTDDLYIGDVGQALWEEIDFEPAASAGGVNYGWRCREGAHVNSTTGLCSPTPVGMIDPVHEYSSADGSGECSVTGGYVFRNLPAHAFTGDYFFGDFCSGHIWRGQGGSGTWSAPPELTSIANSFGLTSFGEGETGRIYVAYQGGSVQWLQPYSFSDVLPTSAMWPWIEAIHGAGITAGCAVSPRRYCPTSSVTRAEMAVFLGRQIHGAAFTPPPATGIFADVLPSHWAAAWVEQLYADGVTSGCASNPLRFCPGSPVTRDQMAVLLLLAKHGSGYTPPPATGAVFADVPAGAFAAAWIEQLYAEGITAGCATAPLRYCPGASVLREQMAVFLARIAELDLP